MPVDSVERERLDTVLDRAFEEPNPLHQRRTRAVVIVHKGHILAERYAAGIGPDTPLIGWSNDEERHQCPRRHSRDVTRATKELDPTPGTKWQYSSGTSDIIARIIRNVLEDDHEYWAYPRRALFDRRGMTGAVMETDAAGASAASRRKPPPRRVDSHPRRVATRPGFVRVGTIG